MGSRPLFRGGFWCICLLLYTWYLHCFAFLDERKTPPLKKCANWDGGQQELNSATQAVRAVFPKAPIENNCVNKYPIRVRITAKVGDGKETELWEGSQKDLFRKYATKREQAMAQIQMNAKKLQSSL